MEVASLQHLELTCETLPHVHLNYYPAKGSTTKNKSHFFYIGENFFKINNSADYLESWTVSASVDNAISLLKRFSAVDPVPDVFIIDAKVSEAAIRQFNIYANSDETYSSIPLVIDASGLHEQEIKKLRAFNFLDEILIDNEISSEKLMEKMSFLKKMKRKATQQLKRKREQSSLIRIKTLLPDLKRSFDIVLSLIAILILSPVFLVIALLIKSESNGPVFYIAKRAGRGYKVFNFFKFRTMIVDADKKVSELSHLNKYNSALNSGPAFFKIDNDPRITKIGAFLRNTSLDELPQLFNVLLGDMSIVGNRPLPLYEAATLTTDDWAARFMAPAGITGLWQIKKRGDKNMTAEERINLDITYAQKYNFVYDLWIMANTPTALFQKENV